jgi:hypothetical protein
MSQSTPETKRQSQVTEQTNNLEGNLGSLHVQIDNLTDRLSSVLRSPEAPLAGEGKDRVELVVLAGTIQGFGDSVRSAINKIEDILERLEL